MTDITQQYTINAPIENVWQSLVDPKEIAAWGGGPAKMNETVGFEFEFWGGDIIGKNITVEPPTKLVQEWGYDSWPQPSVVTFELESSGDGTTVALTQSNHPISEHTSLAQGWNDYYLGAIKEYLEKENKW